VRIIDQALLSEIKKDIYRPIFMFSIEDTSINEFIRINTSSEFIVNPENLELYEPRAFNIGTDIKYSSTEIVQSVQMTIDDTDKMVLNFIVKPNSFYDRFVANLTYAVLDKYFNILGYQKIFFGYLDSWEYTSGEISCSIVSFLSQWTKTTLNSFSSSCRWKAFGGAECKFQASPLQTCDRTYEQCAIYGNTNNFGGFRWLPFLVGKTIQIGKQQDLPQFKK